ncbi:hypothetical protein [Pseudophaeobacter sp.]|uniref:hypothetical protein n=1 Tax=Pseudophaeobacter sp. TaxID=1971739 RepID=UPI00262A51AB|nr:hypothetical protein [Pseudophaeobacter sp.]
MPIPDLAMISAALTALKAGGEATKTTIDLYKTLQENGKDDDLSELRAISAQLSEGLFKARAANLEVQNQLLELQATAQAQNEFDATKSKYFIYRTPFGNSIWKLKEGEDTTQFHEFICPNCLVSKRDFYALQLNQSQNVVVCDSCQQPFRLKTAERPPKQTYSGARRR